jgi:hypothetical protein
MANEWKISNATASAACDAQTLLLNNGYLRIYGGTKPATADTATGESILAELRYNATAFGAASNGVATANALTADSSANNTGTATWFRSLKSDGTTVVGDGTVGTSGADLNLNSVAITSGIEVSVTSHTYTQSKG